MAPQIHQLVEQIRGTMLRKDESGLTDGQLLGQFLEQRDEASLATLLCRHGGMVWGTCRRVLANHHDAEDAFQATFLVLVRKASSIVPREMVGNWLYGVAYQTALKARAAAAKRRTRERQVADMPEPVVREQDRSADLRPILDQELSRLPAKYRRAIVLCDLEGKTRREAARQLGLAEGTLAGHLTRGRSILGKRLARHGFTVSAGGLASVLGQQTATSCVPTSVLVATLKAGTLVAAGQAAAGLVSARVVALMENVMKAMLIAKVKMILAICAIAAMLLGGILGFRALAADKPNPGGDSPPTGEVPVQVVEKASKPAGSSEGGTKLLRTFGGPSGAIRFVTFTPNGKTLVTCPQSNDFELWDVGTGERRAPAFREVVEGRFRQACGFVVYSPDGKTAATGNGGGPSVVLDLWDVATNKRTFAPKAHVGAVWCAAFSPDGKKVVSGGSDTRVKLWDSSNGELIRTFKGHTDDVQSVAFSPDGKTIASASRDHTVRLWNVATGDCAQTLKGHSDQVSSVVFSPDGKTVVSGSKDKTARIWATVTGKFVATLEGHADAVNSVAYSPNGKLVATGSSDKTVKLWDPETGKNTTTLEGCTLAVTSVAFNPDGKSVACGSGNLDRIDDVGEVKIWDVTTGNATFSREGGYQPVESLFFTGDGKSVGFACRDGVVLRDVATGKQTELVKMRKDEERSSFVKFVALGPDGNTLFAVGGFVTIWDLKERKQIGTMNAHTGFHAPALSPDGKTLAMPGAADSNDRNIGLADVASRRITDVLEGHKQGVSGVAFSPDGKTLASGSYDKTIKLWDLGTLKNVATLEGHSLEVLAVALSPDGKTLASASQDKTVKVWDVSKRECIATLKGHDEAVCCLAFSPDGKMLASGSGDRSKDWSGEVRVWEVAGAKLKAKLEPHSGRVLSLAFSPDGKVLAAGTEDRMIKMWEVGSDD